MAFTLSYYDKGFQRYVHRKVDGSLDDARKVGCDLLISGRITTRESIPKDKWFNDNFMDLDCTHITVSEEESRLGWLVCSEDKSKIVWADEKSCKTVYRADLGGRYVQDMDQIFVDPQNGTLTDKKLNLDGEVVDVVKGVA